MAGRSTPPDPNYKLYGQYGGKAKYLAAKKERDDAKAAANKAKKPYEESNAALQTYLTAPGYGLYAKLNDAKTAHNSSLVASLNAEISKTKAKINLNYTYIYLYETKIKEAQDKFEKKNIIKARDTNGSGDKTEKPGTVFTGAWKFNAPMVNNRSALEKASLPKMISAGPDITGDAKQFWTTPEIGGKGTFQMDRKTNTTEFLAEARKAADKAGRGKEFDPNYYGFKFHYNPTTLNMSWAGVMGANPVFEGANLDPAIPMAQNLFGANITFDIILNRIQDLALLNPDGSYKYGSNPYGTVEVSKADRKTIVEKGTMYDLEYLFHTMHGFMTSTNYRSDLMNTKTNDPGWLPVRPVELHLGTKLRYRVRVLNMEVVHKIFSTSMVPILSVVSFNCARYWDGPTAKDPKKK